VAALGAIASIEKGRKVERGGELCKAMAGHSGPVGGGTEADVERGVKRGGKRRDRGSGRQRGAGGEGERVREVAHCGPHGPTLHTL